MPLTAAQLRAAKPDATRDRYLTDDTIRPGRLRLLIRHGSAPQGAGGGWVWQYRYTVSTGQRRAVALGPYPTLTLEAARAKARELAADGLQRKTTTSFLDVAKGWHSSRQLHATVDARTLDDAWRRLELHALPELGKMAVGEIRIPDVSRTLDATLKRVQARGKGGGEMVKRVRILIGQVFEYAIREELAPSDPSRALRGVYKEQSGEHFAAVTTPDEAAKLLRDVWTYSGYVSTRLALQFAALAFPRAGSIAAMTWDELDLERAIWTCPAAHMKMKRDHCTPLSTQALAVLREAERWRVSEYVFPGNDGHRHSAGTLNMALRRLGYGGKHTAHGFRAMAGSLLRTELRERHEVVEEALAHVVGNRIVAAYSRGQYFDERRVMMQRWGDWVTSSVGS